MKKVTAGMIFGFCFITVVAATQPRLPESLPSLPPLPASETLPTTLPAETQPQTMPVCPPAPEVTCPEPPPPLPPKTITVYKEAKFKWTDNRVLRGLSFGIGGGLLAGLLGGLFLGMFLERKRKV